MKLAPCVVIWVFLISSMYPVFGSSSEYPAYIKNGYDTLKLQHKYTPCIDGVVIENENTLFDWDFTKVETWEELQAKMTFTVPGSVILNSDSDIGRFALKAKDTQLTTTYILHSFVYVNQHILVNPKIIYEDSDPQRFREACGTEYISLVKNGAILNVGFKFTFTDESYKQEFNAGGNIASASGIGARIKMLTEMAKKTTIVEIFYQQLGGDLGELNSIFDSGDIVRCSLEKFDSCESSIRGVMDYSKDKFANSIKRNFQPISFQTEPYPNQPRFYEDPKIEKERSKLLEALDQQEYDLETLTKIKNDPNDEYDIDPRDLGILMKRVFKNIKKLEDSIRSSFKDTDFFLSSATLDRLELHEVEIPVKSFNWKKTVMQNMHFIVPSGFVSVIVPLIYRLCHLRPATI